MNHLGRPPVPVWWAVDITLHRGLEGMISDYVDSSPPTTRHASDAPAVGSEAPSPQPQTLPLSTSRGRDGMEGAGGVPPVRRGGRRFILPEIPPWSGRNVARTQGDRESSVTTESSSATSASGTPAASLQEKHTVDSLGDSSGAAGAAGEGGGGGGGGDRRVESEEGEATCDSTSRRALLAEAALRRLGRGGAGDGGANAGVSD